MATKKQTAGKTAQSDNSAKFAAVFDKAKTEAEGKKILDYMVAGFTEAFNAKFAKAKAKAGPAKSTKESKPEVKPVAEGDKKALKKLALEFHDYSEKAFAITGDTKPVKDICNKYHGRFNRYLSVGAGWIFAKKYEKEVRAALAI